MPDNITGAGGGLGIHAVQMARVCGAQVIAQTSPDKVPLVMSTSRTQLADVIELVRRGRITPTVTEQFPLADAARVHRLMVEKKLSGRVLLMP